jgi:AcrR family transcriptional regulator
MQLFSERGIDGVTVAAIEREAGLAVGTGSFHRHFRSKEDVLLAAIDREVQTLLSALEDGALPSTAPQSSFEDMCRRFGAMFRRADRLLRLMTIDGDRLPQLRAAFEASLERAHAGATRLHDPALAVVIAALGGYHRLGQLEGRDFLGVSPDEFVATLAAHFGDALSTSAPNPRTDDEAGHPGGAAQS